MATTGGPDNGVSTRPGSSSARRLLLYHPDDDYHLTQLLCLVRRQLEAYPLLRAPPLPPSADGDGDGDGHRPPTAQAQTQARARDPPAAAPRRAGVRCIHCAPPPVPFPVARGSGSPMPPAPSDAFRLPLRAGASSLPTSTRLVYQSVRNWQRNHVMACPEIPPDVKDEYKRLKSVKGGGGRRALSLAKGEKKGSGRRKKKIDSASYWEMSCRRMGLVDTSAGLCIRGEVLDGTWTEAMGAAAMTERPEAAPKTALATTSAAAVTASPAASPPPLSLSTAHGTEAAAAEHATAAAAAKQTTPLAARSGDDDDCAVAIALRSFHVASAAAGGGGGGGVAAADRDRFRAFGDGGASAARPSQPPSRDSSGARSYLSPSSSTTMSASAAAAIAAMSPLRLPDAGIGRAVPSAAAASATRTSPSPLSMTTTTTTRQQHVAPSEEDVKEAAVATDDTPRRRDAAAGPPPQPQPGASQSSSWTSAGGGTSTPEMRDRIDRRESSTPASAAAAAETGFSSSNVAAHGAAERGGGGGGGGPTTAPPPTSVVTWRDAFEDDPFSAVAVADDDAEPLPFAPSPPLPSRVDLLGRLQLALGAVQAVSGMLTFAPSSLGPGAHHGCGDDGGGGEDLTYLGAELYELFAGRQPYSPCDEEASFSGGNGHGNGHDGNADGGAAAADEAYASHQRRKRDKRFPATTNNQRRSYTPLRELGLPSPLCDLVSGLLDGNVSYGSAAEVEEDLLLIAKHPERYLFHNTNSVRREESRPSPPSPPRRRRALLRGREEEERRLLDAYERSIDPNARTNAAVFVSGYSGTGKSSLVTDGAFRDELDRRGAVFVSGKFDAMRQMRPLSAIVSALDDLCDVLARDPARSEEVRSVLAAAAGHEGGVLTDMIPNLRRVLRPTQHHRHDDDDDESSSEWSPPSPVSGREAMQRLTFLFRLLLRSAISRDRPAVLFLDDLQWADEVSLDLIAALVTDSDLRGLLFVGSYRDNEVGPDHPLSTRLVEIIERSGSVDVRSVVLGNLDATGVNAVVAEAVGTLPRGARDLSREVLRKTGGNLLFVTEFLASLRDEGLLSYSLTERRWEWEIDKIRERSITAGNVVEFMTAKLRGLPPEVREALGVAAGFGAQCHEDLLRIVDRAAPDRVGVVAATDTASALDVAASEGLVVKAGHVYRFSHDQIQRASYLLTPPHEREAFHLRLGKILWANCTVDELDAHLFVVADQLHRGAALLYDRGEKIALAKLSLLAGRKAVAVSAFLPASANFKAGISLISDEEGDWEVHRDTAFDLHNAAAEMDHILGDFDGMQQHLSAVLTRARTLAERIRPNFNLVQSLGAQGRVIEAIDTAMPVLAELGEAFPETVSNAVAGRELMATHGLVSKLSEAEITKMEPMDNADKEEAMKFLNCLLYYAFTGKKEYFPLIACRMVRLSLEHGVCRDSAVGFSSFGMLLCTVASDFEGGYRFGKMGILLMERFHVWEHLAKIYVLVYAIINNFKDPVQASLPNLKMAVDVGLTTGDTESAMLAAHSYVGVALVSGRPLAVLVEEMSHYAKQMAECKQHHIYTINRPSRQAALYLVGSLSDTTDLARKEADEGSLFDDIEGDSAKAHLNALHLFHRMWLQYLFGQYEQAHHTANLLQKETSAGGGFPRKTQATFYSGLIALVLARKSGTSHHFSDTIQQAIAQMQKGAATSPWNCDHKVGLLKAEYAFLEGDYEGAAEAYDASIELAAAHSFTNEHALALERAGIFFLEIGEQCRASVYFVKAHECYTQWGAHRKAAHILGQYM